MDDCIFCKIINKEVPATIVYEDDNIIAFNDIRPVTKIHVLVVPKKHIQDLPSVENDETLNQINSAIKEVAKIKGMDKDGYRVIINVGENGGQAVPHLHFHILGGQKLPTW